MSNKMNTLTLVSILTSLVSAGVIPQDHLLKRSSSNGVFVQKVSGDLTPFVGSISVGTPAQEIDVLFDTGSFSFNVNAPNSTACYDDGCYFGTYNAFNSTTADITDKQYSTSYLDGSSKGVYVSDVAAIGGDSINLTFGYLYDSDGTNIFGLGYYPSTDKILLSQLESTGLASNKVFSTYYSSISQSGAVVFGGLDSAKYTGTLETVPSTEDYIVELSAIGTDCDIITSTPANFTLDTGSSGSMMEPHIYHQIHQALGGVLATNDFGDWGQSDGTETYVIKCSTAVDLYFWFSGKKLTVSPSTYALALVDADGNNIFDSDGDQVCSTVFTSGSYNIIGGTTLKDFFVVWDGENNQIALANKAETTEESLLQISENEIPGAVPAAAYSGAVNDVGTYYPTPNTTTLDATGINVLSRYTGPFVTSECTGTTPTSYPQSSFTSVASSSSSKFLSKLETLSTDTVDGTAITYLATTIRRTQTSGVCLSCVTSTATPTSKTTISTTIRRTSTVGTCLSCVTSTYTTSIAAVGTTSSSSLITTTPSTTSSTTSSTATISSTTSSSTIPSTTSSATTSSSTTSATSSSTSSSSSDTPSTSSTTAVVSSTVTETITSCSEEGCTVPSSSSTTTSSSSSTAPSTTSSIISSTTSTITSSTSSSTTTSSFSSETPVSSSATFSSTSSSYSSSSITSSTYTSISPEEPSSIFTISSSEVSSSSIPSSLYIPSSSTSSYTTESHSTVTSLSSTEVTSSEVTISSSEAPSTSSEVFSSSEVPASSYNVSTSTASSTLITTVLTVTTSSSVNVITITTEVPCTPTTVDSSVETASTSFDSDSSSTTITTPITESVTSIITPTVAAVTPSETEIESIESSTATDVSSSETTAYVYTTTEGDSTLLVSTELTTYITGDTTVTSTVQTTVPVVATLSSSPASSTASTIQSTTPAISTYEGSGLRLTSSLLLLFVSFLI